MSAVIPTDPEQPVYVTNPEDVILSKLQWYQLRSGRRSSDRQWREVVGVLKVRAAELDLDPLQQGANELNVTDLLQEL